MKPEFTNKWEKQREFYKKAVISDKGDTWPYIVQDVRELAYSNWLKDITDPSTGEFYKGRENKYMPDGKGGETVQIKELEAREEVFSIVRLRTEDGDEFLLTKRNFIGYNQFGTEMRFYMPYKEEYDEPLFKWRTDFDARTRKLIKITDGPAGSIKHYTMLFTPQNVDEVMKLRVKGNVSLVVKDGMSGEGKICPNIDMFKHKPFDYIKNMDYLTPEEKAAALEKLDAQTDTPTGSKRTK